MRVLPLAERVKTEAQQAKEAKRAKQLQSLKRAKDKFEKDITYRALHASVALLFAAQLKHDLEDLKAGKSVSSLAAKWAPSPQREPLSPLKSSLMCKTQESERLLEFAVCILLNRTEVMLAEHWRQRRLSLACGDVQSTTTPARALPAPLQSCSTRRHHIGRRACPMRIMWSWRAGGTRRTTSPPSGTPQRSQRYMLAGSVRVMLLLEYCRAEHVLLGHE